jgi:hypothetical protein
MQLEADTVKNASEAIGVKHKEEIQSLHHKFEVKETELLQKIGGLEKTLEGLKSEHAEEVTKLTKQVEEVRYQK